MIKLTVLYPKNENSHFDMDYYLRTHAALIRERLNPLGLIRVDLQEGIGGITPGTPAPYAMIGSLCFDTMDDLQRSLATHGEEIIADITRFTNVQPEMLITQVVEPVANVHSMASSG